MLAAIIQFVAPMALDVVREKLRARSEPLDDPPNHHGADVESRLLALHGQVEALHRAEAEQIDELAKVLRAIGLRATVGLWLSISSAITAFAMLAFTILKL